MAVKRKDPAGIEFTLLENGLDFVLSAVEHLGGDPSKRDLKYAILHLYSGTLLILKERLFHEDWTLLFAIPEKADEKRLESGDFTGPNLEQCLERLEGIDVEVADGQKTQLRLLGSKRKRLEHYRFTDSAEAVKALTADIVGFLLDFIGAELDSDGALADYTEILDRIRAKLAEFKDFVTLRWKAIEEEVRSAETVTRCPACLEEAWVIQDGTECKFCRYRNNDSQSAADEYITRVMGEDRHTLEKDGGVWPRRKCPACDWFSLVDLEYVENGPQYICFECGTNWEPGELSDCSSCGEPKKDGDMAICDDCFAERVRKDD